MRLQDSTLTQKVGFVDIWCDTVLFTLCGQGKSIYHTAQPETYSPRMARSLDSV